MKPIVLSKPQGELLVVLAKAIAENQHVHAMCNRATGKTTVFEALEQIIRSKPAHVSVEEWLGNIVTEQIPEGRPISVKYHNPTGK